MAEPVGTARAGAERGTERRERDESRAGPQPPVQHPDRQEPQQLQPGAAHDRDDDISVYEEVPAAVKLQSKEAKKHRASISDAAGRAACAGETWVLSSQPPVKRPRSSLLEDEMVQIDETPLDSYPLSIWKNTAPCASPSEDIKHYMQLALGNTSLPRPPIKKHSQRGSSTPGGSKAGRLSCAAEEDVQQGGKKKYKHHFKILKGQSRRQADPLGTSANK